MGKGSNSQNEQKKCSEKPSNLLPACRLISLNKQIEAPLICTCDYNFVPLCQCEHKKLLIPYICYSDTCITKRTCTLNCECDMHICTCDPVCKCDVKCNHCYCDNKGGFSPDNTSAPNDCEAHSRTLFRIADKK